MWIMTYMSGHYAALMPVTGMDLSAGLHIVRGSLLRNKIRLMMVLKIIVMLIWGVGFHILLRVTRYGQ